MMNSQIHNLLTKGFSFIFILLLLSISNFTFAENNTLTFGKKWSISGYSDYNKDIDVYKLYGADIYYNGNIVHHFENCKGFGTASGGNIDDFCGMSFSQIKSGKYGLYFELLTNYPGSIYDPGIYLLTSDGRFILQSTLPLNKECLVYKGGKLVENDGCKYFGYRVLLNGNIVLSMKVQNKIKNILLKTKF